MTTAYGILEQLFKIHGFLKRLIILSVDFCAITFGVHTSFLLKYSTPEHTYIEPIGPVTILAPLIGVTIFSIFGLYREVVRYMTTRLLLLVAFGVISTCLSVYMVSIFFDFERINSTVIIIFGLTCGIYVGGTRIIYRSFYNWYRNSGDLSQRALIFGTGPDALQLLGVLNESKNFKPIGFISDNIRQNRVTLGGIPVYNFEHVEKVIDNKRVGVVLFAERNVKSNRMRSILEKFSLLPVLTKVVPPLDEVVDKHSKVEFENLEVEHLLGRKEINISRELECHHVMGKNICVTGAGGSIGSELCRQLALSGAAEIVLFEASELALYEIEQELGELIVKNNLSLKLTAILGTVTDQDKLLSIFKSFCINIVFHAAAYKHVPLVEKNIEEGLYNNSIGTFRCASAASQAGVDCFILISTDKAVRPTNVMGASKRLAEIFVQLMSSNPQNQTTFAMVRFGNVLGSSGSVLPLFKAQIKKGGPLTVTHPDINRYFMTIPEASNLVIQAGAMAKGGEVFVLDMGEPIKISTLAETMIRLSGHSVRSESNPHGDIEIFYSGLRPGEKLFEELLIGDTVIETKNPKILCAMEDVPNGIDLKNSVAKLENLIQDSNIEGIVDFLTSFVAGYQRKIGK